MGQKLRYLNVQVWNCVKFKLLKWKGDVMFYKEINNLVEQLDKDNVEKLKPQLKKYVAQIILSMEDEKLDDEDLSSMLKVVLVREQIQDQVKNQCADNIGLMVDEFSRKYHSFIEECVKEGFLQDAIMITKEVMKSLGCIHREVVVIRNNDKSGDIVPEEYISSEKYLNDLACQVDLELDGYKENKSREYLVTSGLVNLISYKVSENLKEIWNKYI